MNEIKDSKLKQDLKLFQQVKILATQVWQPEFNPQNPRKKVKGEN